MAPAGSVGAATPATPRQRYSWGCRNAGNASRLLPVDSNRSRLVARVHASRCASARGGVAHPLPIVARCLDGRFLRVPVAPLHDGLQASQRLRCVQGTSRGRCALLGALLGHGGGTVPIGMAVVPGTSVALGTHVADERQHPERHQARRWPVGSGLHWQSALQQVHLPVNRKPASHSPCNPKPLICGHKSKRKAKRVPAFGGFSCRKAACHALQGCFPLTGHRRAGAAGAAAAWGWVTARV